MNNKEWEPIPQRKAPREVQDELQIEILPDSPLPKEKPKSNYDMGEDITPSDQSGYIEDGEEE